jgi:hypothetical protein
VRKWSEWEVVGCVRGSGMFGRKRVGESKRVCEEEEGCVGKKGTYLPYVLARRQCWKKGFFVRRRVFVRKRKECMGRKGCM